MNKMVKTGLMIGTGIIACGIVENIISVVNKREKTYQSIVTGLIESLESTHEYFADKATDEYDKKCGAYANGIARAYNEAIRNNSNALSEMGYEDIVESRLSDNHNE